MKDMNNTANQAPAKRSKVKWIVIAAVLLLLLAIAVTGIFLFSKGEESGEDWLAAQLEDSKVTTITLTGDHYLQNPVQVRGEKIIEGEGTIFFAGEADVSLNWKDYQIPEDECYLLGIPELKEQTAMLTVESGSSLTFGGNVKVNALEKALTVNVPAGAKLTIRDQAVVTGGLGTNILNQGEVSVAGGTVLADTYFGIMNYANLSVTGGALESNAENMASVVSSGETVVSGGAMKAKSSTNIYVTDGKLSVTGGTLETAAFDNIYVAKGTAEITGGTITGGHGVHNAGGNVDVTGGQWLSSNHAIYNEGDMTVTGVTIEKTLNHAIVNRGEKAKLVAKDVTIGTATVHGVYNIRGAHMEAENLTVENAMGKGIHNGGAFFTGKNVTINRTMGAGVGNEREKGWQQDGTLTIQGLTIKKAGSKNIVCTAGEVNVSDAALGSIQSNSVQVSGGIVNLKDVEISGTVGSGALHGIYLTGGVVNAEDVTIGSTVGRGIQNRGAQFNGKNITIKDSRATGIGNQLSTDGTTNGTITIDGLEMSGGRGYAIHNVDGGTIDIKNGNVSIANNTGLRVDNGTINLTNFTMTGEESKVTYNGFTINGGKLNLKNVTLKNMTGRGINNMGGTVTGSDVTILNNAHTAIYNEGGKIQLSLVSTSGTKGYNVDTKNGTLQLTDATLGKSVSTSINVNTGSNVILNNVVVNGTQKGHAVYVHKNSKLTFENLSISNAAARALSNGNTSSKVEGGTVVGTDLTITKPAATAIGNDSGTMELKNVKVTDCTANTVNVKSGAVTIEGGELCKTGGTNVVLNGGELNLKSVTIQGTAKDNGITATAGKLTVDNVTITGAAGRGINNIGATVTGTDLTVTKAGASAIYNEGTVDLKNVSLSESTGYNIDAKKGTVKITDGKLAITPVTNVNVSTGAAAELVNVQVLGTTSGHAVYVQKDAKLTFEKLSISNAAARALSNGNTSSKVEGGTIVGTDLTITKSAATAIGNDSGTMKLENVKVTDCSGNNLNVKSGAVTINEGTFGKTNVTNVVLSDGELNLKDVTVQGTAKDNGITATAGKLTVDNVTVTGAAGRGINNIGATITGTGLTVTKAGASAIYNEGAVDLTKVNLSESTGYNIDAKKGTVKITDGKLAITPVTNVNVSAGAAAELANVQVLGTTSGHAVYVQKDAKLTFEKLSISNAAARALSNGNTSSNVEGGTIVGTDLTITKSAATAIGNDSGTMELKNVKVIDCTANTVNVKSGAVTIDGGELCKTDGTNVVLGGGELNLKDVTVQGTAKDNGITATAGKLTVDNVTVTGAAGRGINNIGATVTGTGLTVTKAGASAIYNEGTIDLKNVSLSESTGYNIDAKKGTVKITDGKLSVTPVSNVSVSAGATAELTNTQVLGSTTGHAVTALEDAILVLNNVSISDSAAQALNNRGGKITGSMVTISNAGATAIANESGTMDISGVEVTGSTGYNLDVKTGSVKLTKGAHTGILASTNVANVNVAASETAELILEGITVQGSATKGAIVVGNNAKAAFKDVTVNGEGGLTNGYAISAGNNSKVDLTNVKINGTTNQNAVYVATGAQVKIAELTVTGGKKNALTNNGGVITGSGLTVSSCGTVAVYNAKGDMTLADVNITGGAGHSVNVDAGNVNLTDATLTNATLNIKGGTTNLTDSTITGVTADKKHGINMTGGTVTLHDVTVTNVTGAEARGIYQSAGTLTLTGTTTLGNCKLIGFQPAGGTTYMNGTVTVTDTPNSINVGASGQVHIGANGKLVSNVGIYLPKNGYLTMDAATIGNTAEEPLQIRSSNMSNGSVLVKASSAEAARNALSSVKLLSEDLFIKVSGTDIVVTNQQTVTVDDWAELVAAVESAQAGKPKVIVLTESITQPADGESVTVKDGKNVTITDDGNGYIITRNAAGALFQTGYDGTLTFDGKLTIANTNTSGTALANNGNMTLNNTKLDFSAAYNILSMNGDNAAQTGGHTLTLNDVTMTNVTLTIKGGTVEAEDLTISGVSTNSKHGINMTSGELTLKGNVSITDITGKDARGIYQAGGTLTVAEDAVVTLSNNKLVGGHFSSGTTYINGTIIDTNTANAVNCGATNVHLGAKGKIVSNIGVYLPKNGYLTMDAATIGNTAEEPLKIRSSNMSNGSVLVKASTADAAMNVLSCVELLSEDLFIKIDGTNIVVTDQKEVTVGDWTALVAAVENAESGKMLTIVLENAITQPADGAAITVNNGKNIVISDAGKGYAITHDASAAALFATEGEGTLTISGSVTINGGTGAVMELVSAGNLNLSGVTLKNVSLKITGGKTNVTNTTVTAISTDSKHGINMVGGELTLQGNVTISDTTGANARGIYQAGGTLTVAEDAVVTLSNNKLVGGHFSSGTTYINGTIIDTNTANAVNCGASNVHLGAKGKIVSDIGVYLPKNGYLTMDAATIGNTASEPLKIRSSNIARGSVLVKAGSAEAAQNVLSCVKLLSEGLFTKVDGTNVIATDQTGTPVTDWASLKASIEGAEDGATLVFSLSQSIDQPADGGSITVKGGKTITITDDGKGYTITRNATDALFQTGYDGNLTFEGKLTIANANTSGTALANNGNMILNGTTLDFSAAYNILSMNGDNAAQTGGHNLTLKNVTIKNATLTVKGGKTEADGLTISGVSTDSKHGINMTGGELTLKGNVSITDTTGKDARGIYQAGGTLTVAEDAVVTLSNNKLVGGHFSSGTTYINGTIIDSNTANAVNCGATNVHLGAKGKIVSDIGVYLPKNGYLTMDAATIGNTAEEPLKIRSSNITSGSVLVKASTAEAAQSVLSSVKLLNDALYVRVDGTNVIASEQSGTPVADWASLKAAIEGAEEGAALRLSLTQDVTQPADGGSITVNGGKSITITDDGKGYTITRSAADALFATEGEGTLTVTGKVTVNGGTSAVMELVSAGNLNLSGVTLKNVSLKITGGKTNVTNTTVTAISTDSKHGINMTGGTVTLHNVTVTNITGANARGIYQSGGTLTLTGTTTLSNCKLIGFQPDKGTAYIRGTVQVTDTPNSINVGKNATVYLNADAKIVSNVGIYLPSSGKLHLEQGVTNIGNSASEPLKIRHNNMSSSGCIVLKTDSAEAASNIASYVVILNGTTANQHASYVVTVDGNNVITNLVTKIATRMVGDIAPVEGTTDDTAVIPEASDPVVESDDEMITNEETDDDTVAAPEASDPVVESNDDVITSEEVDDTPVTDPNADDPVAEIDNDMIINEAS